MNIHVPKYGENGFLFEWEANFSIKCTVNNSAVCIEANKAGLISLARHLLELAQDSVPEFTHFHLDDVNSLEDNSLELIVVKKD
jgi:hypothetical protein